MLRPFALTDKLNFVAALQMFSVDLSEPRCSWKHVTDAKGTTPSPRNKHTCWVHRDRSVLSAGVTPATAHQRRRARPGNTNSCG